MLKIYPFSMLTPKFRGNIKLGKLVITDTRFKEYLFNLEGDVSVKIEKWKKDRTLDQNSLYWKYLTIIAEEIGEDSVDNLHEIFKRRFLPPQFVKVMGKEYKIPGSTTKLSTKEFTDYLDKIFRETEIPIPNLENL